MFSSKNVISEWYRSSYDFVKLFILLTVFPHQLQFSFNLFQEKETQDKAWKEQAELLRQEQDREREEKLKHFQEIQSLEERDPKLPDGKELDSWRLKNAP